jgi:hypothetical protein
MHMVYEHGEFTAHLTEDSTLWLNNKGYEYFICLEDPDCDVVSFLDRYGFDKSECYDIMHCMEKAIIEHGLMPHDSYYRSLEAARSKVFQR